MKNLKELRKAKGWSQMTLAEKLDVSLMSVRLWENGAGKPNLENYEKIIKLFDIMPFSEE